MFNAITCQQATLSFNVTHFFYTALKKKVVFIHTDLAGKQQKRKPSNPPLRGKDRQVRATKQGLMGLDNNSLNATAGIYIHILSIEPAGLALNISIGLSCGVF